MTRPIPSVLVASVILIGMCSVSGRADDTDRIRRQIDRLSKEIAESRAFPGSSGSTLEELRQDLFQTALTTRDAKKRSDVVEQAIKDGKNATLELELLRTDITAAGNLLRQLRDHIDALDRVVKNNQALVDEQNASISKLENALLMKPEALDRAVAEKTRKLEKEIETLAEKLAARESRIAVLEQKLATRGASAPPAAPVASNRENAAAMARAFDNLAAGKAADAQAQFEKLIAANPALLDAHAGLAACYFELNNTRSAWNIVNEVLAIDDRNARALGVKGALQFRDGEYKAARKSLERAMKYDNANPFLYNHLGVVQSALNRNDSAIENLKKAVELDPEYVSALFNLSVLLASDRRNPDLDQARYYYQKALSLGSPREPFMDQVLGQP